MDAINSVRQQTYTNWEIIIVDDCSTDNSLAILKEYEAKDDRITVISLDKNMGQAHARNIALQKAEGEYVMFFDDDDICIRNKVEKQVECLDTNPDVDVVTCTTMFDNRNGIMHTLKTLTHADIDELLQTNDIDHI